MFIEQQQRVANFWDPISKTSLELFFYKAISHKDFFAFGQLCSIHFSPIFGWVDGKQHKSYFARGKDLCCSLSPLTVQLMCSRDAI